ncbi:MAG TPA: energy-coupling factor transporter transmembrane protein EcfT [Candidatus Cloacimonetes bacterium]|nr:energy-coupling factor transporter transmembrane protein EcfT [Candidatus Cloacimonadota bacterium]
MNARTYLIISIIISTLSVILHRIEYQLILFGVCILLVLLLNPSKRRFVLLWKRLRFLFILILFLFVMQLLFRQSGSVLFHWKFITIYSEGVLIALIVSIRLLILLLVVSLLFDIPFYNFVLALRDWKLPYEICLMIASTFSFLRLFEKQFKIMKDQLKIREISFRKIPIFRKSRAFSTIVFPVLAQAMHTVRYRAIALDLKGFRLHPTRTDYISHKLKWVDYVIQVLAFWVFIITMYFIIK